MRPYLKLLSALSQLALFAVALFNFNNDPLFFKCAAGLLLFALWDIEEAVRR